MQASYMKESYNFKCKKGRKVELNAHPRSKGSVYGNELTSGPNITCMACISKGEFLTQVTNIFKRVILFVMYTCAKSYLLRVHNDSITLPCIENAFIALWFHGNSV